MFFKTLKKEAQGDQKTLILNKIPLGAPMGTVGLIMYYTSGFALKK